MWHEDVDLLVLGTGAGGLAAAVTGAQEGLATLVLETTEETARWRVFKARQKLMDVLAPKLEREKP